MDGRACTSRRARARIVTTPQFILDLRRSIGHELLWLIGVTAYVRKTDGQILLGRRADTGQWALVYGINEPGEQPADTVVREVKEETGVDVCVTALVCVISSPDVITYANGDRAQYMDHSFLCEVRQDGSAQAYVGDEESLEVGWFDRSDLPSPLADSTRERLELFDRYLANASRGDHHALFIVDGLLH